MAAGLSGWGQGRVRDVHPERLAAHREVQRAEAALAQHQTALRAALTGAADDVDALLGSIAEAEDALLLARQAWTAAAASADPAPQPLRAPRPALAGSGSKRVRRSMAPQPSFTYGSWV